MSVRRPHLVPADWRDRIGDREIVVSFSGGKDSGAVCLALREAGIPFRMVFCDTGWEAAQTYDYIHGPWRDAVGPVEVVSAGEPVPEGYEAEVTEIERKLGRPSDMVRICVRKAMLSSRMMRWCTDELKVAPFKRWTQGRGPLVNAVGVRASESASRSRLDEWDAAPWSPTVDVWRPIFRWSTDDVFAIHARHGIRPNPLYFSGAGRVGCWLCVQAGKDEIARVASMDPVRIEVIRDLERLVGRIQREKRGTATAPGWFMHPNPPREPVVVNQDAIDAWEAEHGGQVLLSPDTPPRPEPRILKRVPKGAGGCWPIDRIVEWASDPSQPDFDYPHDGACMRLGFCESPAGDNGGTP